MDHPVVIGTRPTGDHPVVIGQRPTGDAGVGATEHLAPLIFMVMAFLITVITGVVLRERGFIWNPSDRLFWKSPIVIAALAICCAVVAILLLLNVNYYLSDAHPGILSSTHSHHDTEIWLAIAACILVFLTLLSFGSFVKIIFVLVAGVAEMVVIVILLNIFPDQIYKMCNGQCVMRGSQAGVAFDLPCADNVAFMSLHHATEIHPQVYLDSFATTSELPHFLDYATAIALHDPIYPAVTPQGSGTQSEMITFTLDETEVNPVALCSLYVIARSYTKAELESPTFSFDTLPESSSTLVATWSRTGSVLKKTFPSSTPGGDVVGNIAHAQTVRGENNKVTYVSYKFRIVYSNPPDVTHTPAENVEVTFVLQDYYSIFPDRPVPVYTQRDLRDAMDLLFIPAQSDAITDPLDEAFFSEFRTSCRSIIKDAVFQEPSIKFWRKHFNFWINPAAGRAMDGRCGDCCHVQPANIDLIPTEIEFKALLHRDVQLDFTDHCNRLFSAEMRLMNEHNEKSSFLHELGHAAFGLCDEYPGGYNYQATDHLPNNWETRRDARHDAPLRHKSETDVVRLY
jgi:hypothetical protein